MAGGQWLTSVGVTQEPGDGTCAPKSPGTVGNSLPVSRSDEFSARYFQLSCQFVIYLKSKCGFKEQVDSAFRPGSLRRAEPSCSGQPPSSRPEQGRNGSCFSLSWCPERPPFSLPTSRSPRVASNAPLMFSGWPLVSSLLHDPDLPGHLHRVAIATPRPGVRRLLAQRPGRN